MFGQDDFVHHPKEEDMVRKCNRVHRKPKHFNLLIEGSSSTKMVEKYDIENSTLKQALSSDDAAKWTPDIELKMAELRARKMQTILEKPEGVKVLQSKIALKLRRHSDGSMDKFNARQVALGCFQDKGTSNKFAPEVDYTKVRVALVIAALNKCRVHQLDVTEAFLHRDSNNPVYMYQTSGYEEQGKETLVCKLNKSIYGLKQAPRVWY